MGIKQFDVIIIGSGLGGLTAGAKLAKEGKRVLLIEQHNIPGGCATTFKRKDYTMEVGLHAIDGLDEQDPKKKVFEDLGVFDHVQFIQTNEFYRIRNESLDSTIPCSTQTATEYLIRKFPSEKKGIKKFFKTICDIRKEVGQLPEDRTLLFYRRLYPCFLLDGVFSTARLCRVS